ncbi:MAG: (d)CMP kinase [Chlamydiia bacterium]
MIITIDGPAGTGKSTVARRLAAQLGFVYFDTGAMYRALTFQILREKIALDDEQGSRGIVEQFSFHIRPSPAGPRYIVGDEDVSEVIRSVEVTAAVSQVAALPWVRHSLVNIQRKFGSDCNAVFEGRDLGSVVFPNADLKVFLTASPEVRSQRRYDEWLAKNPQDAPSKEQVLRDLLQRDHLDSTRQHSPLIQPQDALVIDTSGLTVEQIVDRLVTAWHNKHL